MNRLFIVFILGFSSGLPLSLLGSTLQAWFASSEMSIMATGMLSLLGIPYAYKFLWAPLLDCFGRNSLGRRRSWLFLTQLLLVLGFNLFAYGAPETSAGCMVLLALLLSFVSATQDIAVDAQRVEYLAYPLHALGASVAVLGYRLALLISGGLSLILAQHLGFAMTYRIMGGLMFLGVLATWLSDEPNVAVCEAVSLKQAYLAPLMNLWSRKHIVSFFLFAFFYKLGEAFTSTTSGIVMPFLIQGLGFELETIGYVNKILGVTAVIIGGLVAGLLLIRWSLYRALFCFGMLQAFTNIFFILLAQKGANLVLLCVAVATDNFATGMGSTAIVALFMRSVDSRYTATQMAILVAFSSLPRIFSGPFSAWVQGYLGWVGLYQIAFILSLLFIPFLIKIRNKVDHSLIL